MFIREKRELKFSGLLCELAYAKKELNREEDIKHIDVIIDCHKLSLRHLYGLSKKFAKRMVFFMSECLPMKLLHVYVIRQPKIFCLGYALYKPFIEDRMKRLIHICGHNYDLMLENIGRETLPPELNGTSKILIPSRWLSILYQENTQEELAKSGYEFYDGSPSPV
ncbi:hypothetical protein NQ318_002771 [Aromia moschata]|uniref:CRAL-TRIO domain-containing protein n=1 Tax=Aromia moschata TaxID=1265417 RepID=A0AAV8X4S6_9CUCU|nr:hypothetical protein NQ318_002771 [Aromia moschata]